MLAPLVGQIDSRLEMLARDEHTSLFVEIINYVANIVETEKHLLCYLLFVHCENLLVKLTLGWKC
jgi:hypothetical protein